MASIGNGVNKDASGVALRLTYYNDSHADAQNDQSGDYRYNHSKIWACMGRVGVNGVMRDGLVEEGDPVAGYAAGSIQEFFAGAFGAEKWNTLNAYTLNGFAGDMVYLGALDPWDEFMFHLQAAVVGPPAVAIEYWNGAAWTADTLTLTPDFSGATGLNQRMKCAVPSNWASKADGATNEVRYWRRVRQTANGNAVALNFGYKDYFYGHIRRLFCAYDLKRGDDGSGTATTEFRDDGFVIKYRAGKRADSRTTVPSPWQLGSVSNASHRRALGRPWCMISTRGHVLHPVKAYGGMIMGRVEAYSAAVPGVALRGLSSEVVGVDIVGFHENVLGATGTAALMLCEDVRVSIDRDATPGGVLRPINNLSIDPSGIAADIKVDVHDVAAAAAVNSSISAGTIRGLTLTNDSGTAQLFRSGGSGPIELFDTTWGGPNNKAINGTTASPWREWRYLTFRIWQRDTFSALQGIPVRATGSDSVKQLEGVTDVNGQTLTLANLISGAPVVGLQNQSIFLTEKWTDPTGATSTLLDNPMLIDINPKDHPNWNPLYVTHTIRDRWPRKLIYDATDSTWKYADYQRENRIEIAIGLPLVTDPAPITIDTIAMPAWPEEMVLTPV